MALVPFPNKGAKMSAPDRDPDDWDDEDDTAEQSGGKMSFLDHLDELRRRMQLKTLLFDMGETFRVLLQCRDNQSEGGGGNR